MNFDESLADFGCGPEEEICMSKNAAAFLKSYARTSTVLNKVGELVESDKKEELVREYLDFCYDGRAQTAKNVVDITLGDKDFESITSTSLPNIKGGSANSLYLVEFFTHCCINCIHSIEDVRDVHDAIGAKFDTCVENCSNGFEGMKVLSVHSPKFPREKDMESIRAFCKRMKMDHSEVVNDPNCVLWNELGVTCWPTLLILGPNPEGTGPNLLFTLMGEGHKDELMLLVKTAMKYLCSSSMQMHGKTGGIKSNEKGVVATPISSDVVTNSFFRFPGKIAMYDDQIVVADSGNNRLIVLRSTGHVERVIGGPQRGNVDGNLNDAQFYNPQGIAFVNKFVFYVADTGNHSIRKVDLQLNHVTTLISATTQTEMNGEKVTLKSPWDLAFYNSETLIIAAAGNHQLFAYFFNDTNLFGVEHKANTFSVVAGSGREENRNNSYILKASFAQPSGITVVTGNQGENTVYIADSESSSIRAITHKGQVVGVVGGSRDPTDLFAFGDNDGKGIIAKLQHPIGVCAGRNPTEILIADTYNHKIKKINVESKECTTFISTSLNEPSGICKDPSRDFLYVADTNNHSIKVIDLENANLHEMKIILPDNVDSTKVNHIMEKFDKQFHVSVSPKAVKLNFSLSPLPDAYEAGRWKIINAPSFINIVPRNGEIETRANTEDGLFSLTLTTNHAEKMFEFYISTDIFFCTSNSCLKRTRKIKVVCNNDSLEDITEKTLSWKDLTWE